MTPTEALDVGLLVRHLSGAEHADPAVLVEAAASLGRHLGLRVDTETTRAAFEALAERGWKDCSHCGGPGCEVTCARQAEIDQALALAGGGS